MHVCFVCLGRVSFLTNYSWQWSLVAGVIGYMWGVRSYQNVCMDKLMHLEHSTLADLKRKSIAMKYLHMISRVHNRLLMILILPLCTHVLKPEDLHSFQAKLIVFYCLLLEV